MATKKYETRRLETWDKAKEMRRKHDMAIEEASSKKELLAQGNTFFTVGFPAVRIVEDNPVGAMIANQSESFARACRATCEIRGAGREVCGYQLNCWGAMFLDLLPDGNKFPKRDMVIPQPMPCNQHAKKGQWCMDYNNIPRWGADMPIYNDTPDPRRDKAMLDNVVGCILDQIEAIERVFGQKFDDDKLIESIKFGFKYRELAGEVCCMMQAVPSPLSAKEMYSFYTLGGLTRTDVEETLGLWRMFRDEVKWRVQNQIAAVAEERFRWVEDMPPPWHFLKYYRYMEKYGAVCIGSPYSHSIGSPYEWRADGTYGPKKSPLDTGLQLRTREDAVRASVTGRYGYYDDFKIEPLVDMARAFKVDGALLPLWRCGVGCVNGRREQGLTLTEMGLKVMYYESSQPGDRTDMDENRVLDQLDVWMESQGFRKLED